METPLESHTFVGPERPSKGDDGIYTFRRICVGQDDWLQDQWLQLDKFPTRCRDVRGVGLAIGQDHNSDPGLSTDEGTRYKVQVFYAGRLSASLQSGNPFLTPKVKAKQFFVTPITIQHSTRVHFPRIFRCSTTRLETRKSGLIFFFRRFCQYFQVDRSGQCSKVTLGLTSSQM